MIEYNEETYVSASEVAKRLQISQGTCYNNVLPTLTGYSLPGRKYTVYRLSDVEALAQVHVVEKQPPTLTLARKVAP